jgi:hypothetical protein
MRTVAGATSKPGTGSGEQVGLEGQNAQRVQRSGEGGMDDLDPFHPIELRENPRDRAEIPQREAREVPRIRGLDVTTVEVNTREIHAPLFKVG